MIILIIRRATAKEERSPTARLEVKVEALAKDRIGPHDQPHAKVHDLLMAAVEGGAHPEADQDQPDQAPPLQSGKNRARRT